MTQSNLDPEWLARFEHAGQDDKRQMAEALVADWVHAPRPSPVSCQPVFAASPVLAFAALLHALLAGPSNSSSLYFAGRSLWRRHRPAQSSKCCSALPDRGDCDDWPGDLLG
jgi:hypothetical protein